MTETGRSAAPPAGDATLDTPPPSEGAVPTVPLSSAGRYRIDGELGRGGLGRVLLAFDGALGRPVALKTLLVDTPLARARFSREAAFAAKLQHPAIVPIYEAGVDERGAPFHAMPLVSGVTLQAAITRTRTLDERLALLPHVQSVADAIAYAHSRGVIHRDIKPANVLIGPFGETVVIDWGVAKAVGDAEDPVESGSIEPGLSSDLTAVGSVVGTPAYMAPEQARGDGVDTRIDVYALGALLYHVLAGTPPLAGDEGDVLERRRRGEAPMPLIERAPGLPVDLDRIVRKAMSLEPGSRYASAAELADDLRRFQTGQLISAHEYGRVELLRRWLKRHAAAVIAGLLVLSVVGVMAGFGVSRIVRERDRAEVAREDALARADALILAQADSERMRDPTAAAAWLESYPASGLDPERRFELALATTADPIAWTALSHDDDGIYFSSLDLSTDRAITFGWTETVVWSMGQPGGRPPEPLWRTPQASPVTAIAALKGEGGTTSHVAVADQGGDVAVIDTLALTRRPLMRSNGAITLVAGSALPSVLALATDRSLTRLTGRGWGHRHDYPADVRQLVVARDGSIIFATDDALWRWPLNGSPTSLGSHVGPITALVVSPNLDAVYTGSASGELFRAPFGPGGGLRDARRTFAAGVTALAIAADGRDLIVGDKAGQVWRMDPMSAAEPTPLFRHTEAVTALAMQPGARCVASTSSDGRLAMWSLSTGASRVYRGHETLIGPISFSPSGDLVSTTGMDGLVRVWPTAGLDMQVVTRPAVATHAAFSTDGRHLASDGDDGSVLLVDLETGARREQRSHAGRVYGIEASKTGALFVSAGFDGRAVVWDAERGTHETYAGHDGRVRKAQFGPDARRVYTAGNDGTVRRFDRATGQGQILHRARGRVFDIEVLADESVIVAVSEDGNLTRTSLASGETRVITSELAGSPSSAFELGRVDDTAVLVCRGETRIEKYAAGGELAAAWDVPAPVNCTRLAGRGRRVAFTSEETLWTISGDGGPVRIGRTTEAIHAMTLGENGDLVATSSLDGTVTVWRLDTTTGELRGATIASRHDGAAFGVALADDGVRVASVGFDQRLRVATLAEGSWVPRAPEALGDWLATLTTWRVSGDRATPRAR